MAEIYVTSTADSGAGSLRQAITDAADGDVILFDSDVFPVGQTTAILLSSLIVTSKAVSLYGGFPDGQGGYTSGATITRYVVREVEGVETEVVVDDDHPAAEGEIVLMHVTTRVALDGQAVQDPDAADEWSGWTGSRLISFSASTVATIAGIAFINGLSTTSEMPPFLHIEGTDEDHGDYAVTDCSFKNGINTAGYCGGVRIRRALARLESCEFDNCKAKTYGGAIYTPYTTTTTLVSCVATNCSAMFGGAVTTYSTSQNTLIDCTIVNCNATSYGGAIFSTGESQISLTNCIIANCAAPYGGGIEAGMSSQCNLTSCTITNCSASRNGGALYSNNDAINTLTDCTITGCSASVNGGAVCSAYASQNTLTGCTITDCVAASGGGVFSSSTSQNILNDCTLTNCNGTVTGGGVYTNNASQNTLTDCVVDSCTSENGGGVYSYVDGKNLLNNCIVKNCTATKSGGGLFSNQRSYMTVNSCRIENCSGANGGGAYFTNESQNTLTDCVVDSCSATAGGGAVYTYTNSRTTFNNCRITNCTATAGGAAIYSAGTTQNTLNNCDLGDHANYVGVTSVLICNTSMLGSVNTASNASLIITGGVTILKRLVTNKATIDDGAALTITDSATFATGTQITSEGRGYLAVGVGIDTSAATLTNVVLCAYGADVSSFAEVDGVLEWEAANPTTTVLIERADGDSWTTVTQTASENLTLYLPPSATVRLFDGVQFFVAQAPAQRTYYYIGGSEGSFTSASDWSLRRGWTAITEPPVVTGQRFIVGDISSGE